MKTMDTLRWGYRGIRQRKLRAALTILGIMIGVASVIALVSQTEGIQSNIVNQINQLGPTTISIRPSSTVTQLTDSDVNRISQIPGVEYVVPVMVTPVKIYGMGTSRSFTLIGIDPAQFPILVDGATFKEGRMYQSLSFSEATVGINVKYPQDMNMPLITLGQSTTFEFGMINPIRKSVQVVGVLNAYGASSLVSVDDGVFMPIKGTMALLGKSSYTTLFVKTVDVDAVDAVVGNIKASYGTSLNILTVKQITEIVATIISELTTLLGAIAAISLFVAGLGIMNIMFVSVIERTREIGVLKALGFKRDNILSIFLTEATMMGVIGGLMGILLGTGISYLIPIILSGIYSSNTEQSSNVGGSSAFSSSFGSMSYTPLIRPEIVILVFIFAMTVSLIAGYYPARRASRMDPVVALRHD